MRHDTDHLAAAQRIRLALDRLAGALSDARLDAVLAAESDLAAAVAAWPGSTASAGPAPGAGGQGREALRLELRLLRASVQRCRRHGAALNAFAGASLSTECPAGYGKAGSPPPAQPRRSWEARA